MNLRTRFVLSVASLALALPSAAHAATITYTATGSGSGGPLSASATFTTSAGQVAITLSNTLALSSFVSVGQTVSDLSFNVSSPAGVVCCSTASGQQGNISSTGLVTLVSGSPDRFVGGPNGGLYLVNNSGTGSSVLMESVFQGLPTQLIAPFESTGSYPNTNPGIAANNPYTIGPATFTLGLAGVTSATTISNVSFSFGTGPDTTLSGTPATTSVTPEPESLWLALSGAMSVGAVQFGRKFRTAKI